MKHSDLAQLAEASYTRIPRWQSDLNPRARAVMDLIDGAVVISIPGTDPKVVEDLVTDGDCDAKWVPGLGFCHDGFQKIALALWPMVRHGLVTQKVIFTGHSLGGAVALILAALTAKSKLVKEVELVTFGCPRVGAQRLAWELTGVKKTLYRFGADPVTQVPWVIWRLPPVLCMHPTTVKRIGEPGFPLIGGNHAIAKYVAELTRLGL